MNYQNRKLKFKFFLVFLGIFIYYGSFTSFASSLNKNQITIITVEGHLEHLNVEYARSEEEKSIGLMFREELDDDEGMLFIWDTDSLRQFWMKNTLIDLDILFINSEYQVVHIEESAQKGSTSLISSKFPAKFVLEIKAGQSQLRNISPGAILSVKNLQN